MITLTPGAAPSAVESAGLDQIMDEFTTLRDHIMNQAKTTAEDVNRNIDDELKVFRNDINEKLKPFGVNKVILKELEQSFKNEINNNDRSRTEVKVFLKNISGWFSKKYTRTYPCTFIGHFHQCRKPVKEQVCNGLPKKIDEFHKDVNSKISNANQVKDEPIPIVSLLDDEPRPAAPGLEPLSSDDDDL